MRAAGRRGRWGLEGPRLQPERRRLEGRGLGPEPRRRGGRRRRGGARGWSAGGGRRGGGPGAEVSGARGRGAEALWLRSAGGRGRGPLGALGDSGPLGAAVRRERARARCAACSKRASETGGPEVSGGRPHPPLPLSSRREGPGKGTAAPSFLLGLLHSPHPDLSSDEGFGNLGRVPGPWHRGRWGGSAEGGCTDVSGGGVRA